jgi:hypothetical protein
VHFTAHQYPADALAEQSWGDFSRAALMRPSALMQWLRLPTLAGMACGLLAIAGAAYGGAVRRAGSRVPSAAAAATP